MSSQNKDQRINFASIKNQFDYPDFLEVQLKSFHIQVQNIIVDSESNNHIAFITVYHSLISVKLFLRYDLNST